MNYSPPFSLDNKTDNELGSVQLFVDYPEYLLTLISFCYILFVFIGVPGNFITIVSLLKSKNILNATAVFIVNLAVSDLLYCALYLPTLASTYWARRWMYGRTWCRLHPLVIYMFSIVSNYTIVAIAINRCVLISHPILYKKIYTKKKICIMLITLWTFALGTIALPFFDIWGRISLDPQTNSCAIILNENNNYPKKIMPILWFMTVYPTILVCYIHILLVVRRSSIKSKTQRLKTLGSTTNAACNTESSNDDSTESSDSKYELDLIESGYGIKIVPIQTNENKTIKLPTKKGDKKLRTMVLAIIICMFIFNVPIAIRVLFEEKFAKYRSFNIIAYILISIPPCINPVLYVVMSKEYRQAYKYMFKWNTQVK